MDKIKKHKGIIIFIAVLLVAFAMTFTQKSSAAEYSGKVKVILRENVYLNGSLYDSKNSEYPILYYNSTPYIPLTWNNMQFLGLKFRVFDSETDTGTGDGVLDGISICNAPTTSEYVEYPKAGDNESELYAEVLELSVYINTKALQEWEDLLFFRNIYYFPLTQSTACYILGWDFAFDADGTIRIETRNAVRPEGFNDERVGKCGLCYADYILTYDGYLEYRTGRDENGSFGKFVWRERGSEEKSFDFTSRLGNLTYLDYCKDSENGKLVRAEIAPIKQGNTLVMFGYIYVPPAPKIGFTSNALVVFDLEKCEVICLAALDS